MADIAVSRPNQPLFDEDPAKWMDWMLTQDPSYQLPGAYEMHDGQVRHKPEPFINKVGKYAPYVGFAAAGGIGAANAGLFGGGATAASEAAAPGATASAGGSGAAAASGGMTASNWLDVGKLGAEFLGGLLSPKPQKRIGYHGALTNPEDSLAMAMNAIQRLGSGLDDQVKRGVHLRALMPSAPDPVSIPGLSVKIGGSSPSGGPHLDQPLDLPGVDTFQPFNGYGQNLFQSSNPPRTPTRRRNP